MLPDLDESDFDIRNLTAEELALVPFDLVKWQCKIKLCKCFTRIKDFGMHPLYLQGKRKPQWINVYQRFFVCSKHWVRYRNKDWKDMPLKKTKNGNIVNGIWEQPGKEKIIY